MLLQDRLPLLETIELKSGCHSAESQQFCAMEMVAYLAGEPHSDHPECTSPIIATFLRSWNDGLNDADRNRIMKPLLVASIGTNIGPEAEEKRAWMVTDWLARECAPAWLKVAGLMEEADALINCAEIASTATCTAAQPSLDIARDKTAAARDAARAAAWDAAWAAARAAAWDAAWAAARAAAKSGGDARAAADLILAPTKELLQASAIRLIERLIEVK